MTDENILLDELPGGSKTQAARCTTETREETQTNQNHCDEEQQRARHCALGLNAYTHRDRGDIRPFYLERGLGIESQNAFHFIMRPQHRKRWDALLERQWRLGVMREEKSEARVLYTFPFPFIRPGRVFLSISTQPRHGVRGFGTYPFFFSPVLTGIFFS
jgi:hypothetical protein